MSENGATSHLYVWFNVVQLQPATVVSAWLSRSDQPWKALHLCNGFLVVDEKILLEKQIGAMNIIWWSLFCCLCTILAYLGKMVLKLRITLQNSVHQNCYLLVLSYRPPNEVPARDPFPPPVGFPLSLLVASSEINCCLVESSYEIWERSLATFRFCCLPFLLSFDFWLPRPSSRIAQILSWCGVTAELTHCLYG